MTKIAYPKHVITNLSKLGQNNTLEEACTGKDVKKFENALFDKMDEKTADFSRKYILAKGVWIDEVTARILRHEGINPVFCAIVAYNIGPFSLGFVEQDKITPFASVRDEGSIVRLTKGSDSVEWRGPSTIQIKGLTEVIAKAIIGRPLKDVVDHPALRDMDLKITSRSERLFRVSGNSRLTGQNLVKWLE
jgi:hypothetical protein